MTVFDAVVVVASDNNESAGESSTTIDDDETRHFSSSLDDSTCVSIWVCSNSLMLMFDDDDNDDVSSSSLATVVSSVDVSSSERRCRKVSKTESSVTISVVGMSMDVVDWEAAWVAELDSSSELLLEKPNCVSLPLLLFTLFEIIMSSLSIPRVCFVSPF